MRQNSLPAGIAIALAAVISGCVGVPDNYTVLKPCCHEKDRPVAIRRMKPMIPGVAAYEKVVGEVKLNFSVAADGSVMHVKVVQARFRSGVDTTPDPTAEHAMERAAIHAMRQWKFNPRRVDGKPVATPRLCQIYKFSDSSA